MAKRNDTSAISPLLPRESATLLFPNKTTVVISGDTDIIRQIIERLSGQDWIYTE